MSTAARAACSKGLHCHTPPVYTENGSGQEPQHRSRRELPSESRCVTWWPRHVLLGCSSAAAPSDATKRGREGTPDPNPRNLSILRTTKGPGTKGAWRSSVCSPQPVPIGIITITIVISIVISISSPLIKQAAPAIALHSSRGVAGAITRPMRARLTAGCWAAACGCACQRIHVFVIACMARH